MNVRVFNDSRLTKIGLTNTKVFIQIFWDSNIGNIEARPMAEFDKFSFGRSHGQNEIRIKKDLAIVFIESGRKIQGYPDRGIAIGLFRGVISAPAARALV